MRKYSPFKARPSISKGIFCDKSPLATDVMTRANSLVGWTKLEIRELMESMPVAQAPLTGPMEARSVNLPSSPTMALTRENSLIIFSFKSKISLRTSPISLGRPSSSTEKRTERSPWRTALAI